MTDRRRTQLLRFFIASIGLNAALGILALLAGDFGQTEAKILVTSVLVSAAALSVLVNGAPIQQRSLWPIPAIAAASAAAAFGLLIVLMWAEIDNDVPLKTVGTALVIGAAGTLAGLLQLIELRPRHQWAKLVNDGLISILALSVVWGIWAEPSGTWYARAIGVESILVAATTLAIPILWRFGRAIPADGDERPVSSLAAHRVVSVEPTETLRSAVELLADQGVGVLVVGDSNSVAGMISERDVVLALRDGADLDEIQVADIMSTSLVTVSDRASIGEAARRMSEQGVRHLLVLGDNGGIVSARDLLRDA